MTCEPTNIPAADQMDIPALRQKYREERNLRLRPEGQEQYTPAAERSDAIDYSDPHMPRLPRQSLSEHVDVVVLGGGWAGVLAGYHLRKAGVENIRIIEQAGDFGGVWYWKGIRACPVTTTPIAISPCWRRCSSFRRRSSPMDSRSESTVKASQGGSIYIGRTVSYPCQCVALG